MAVEVAGTCLHWSSPQLIRGHVSAKTLAHTISSLLHNPSRNYRDRVMTHNIAHHTAFLGTALLHLSNQRRIARDGGRVASRSASLDGFVDGSENEEEEFVERINQLNLRFKIEAEFQRDEDAEPNRDCNETSPSYSAFEEIPSVTPTSDPISPVRILINPKIPAPPEFWPGRDRFELEKMERRANSFDLPMSLRILKRKKKRWELDKRTDSACSSVKKAFDSMVFILRELQSHVIRMRESLLSPDNIQIQGTLARVHGELHASFVWLFQCIFSASPTLMIYLMLLLANFTVFSITNHHVPPQSVAAATEESRNPNLRFDSPNIKTFSVCRSAAVGGGGGKPPAVAGAAADGHSDWSSSSLGHEGAISPEVATEWKRVTEETAEMIRASGRHEALMDPDTSRRFVSPVTVEVEPDDLSDFSPTELAYIVGLSENPDHALLLSNFAQFLYIVHRDYDRAEEYFKRAIRAGPAEAETLLRYANFLWLARKDLEAAEETFLEAISADPGNSHYSASYAHFLWTTGGEDTCYPLGDCDS